MSTHSLARSMLLFSIVLSGLLSASGSFVYFEVIERTPQIDASQSQIGCHPATFTGENRQLSDVEAIVANPENACLEDEDDELSNPESYSGKTIIVRRGECTFAEKVRHALAVNASAIVIVDNLPGHVPVEMQMGSSPNDEENRYNDPQQEPNGVGIPACMAFSTAWEVLAGAGVSGVRLSWTNYRKYDLRDERLPENDITHIAVSQLHGGWDELPAAQATFNPEYPGTEADAVLVEWDSRCTNGPDCDVCRSLPHQLSNHAQVANNVAVVLLRPDPTDFCVEWIYELVVIAEKARAVAVVFVNLDDTLWTYIPYLVPVKFQIPLLNVMASHGMALAHRLDLGQEVRIKVPQLRYFPEGCQEQVAVCIASGPMLELQVSRPLGLTALLVVNFEEEEEGEAAAAAA
eukprot:CAMPEP_0181308636 /NCGR_PEP_ID=MMETSP1101-20121128/11575_1 /TAXON_ID=46948 /ORGANISM="Rhodomonas abbreviata, Strain Caron Lab Isolate" /LENGTH=404 /DNA_ID=CAMNT_0023415045 /DNA_START=131 /DNA_END=1342 /DNA_ORIENTATION=-